MNSRTSGIFRVFGLAFVVLCGLIFLGYRQAEAKIAESLRGFGDELAKLHSLSVHSAPRRLNVNGLELHVVTASTALDVTEALDRFQATCRSVGQIDMPATLRQQLEDGQTGQRTVPWGVVRQGSDTEGFLACLDVGGGLDGEGFLRKLAQFGQTQNLRDLGQLRYALARRHADRTTLLVLWTEGDVRLNEMFPKLGDAPGRDIPELPRPKGTRRMLSAFEVGQPYGLATYTLEPPWQPGAEAGFIDELQQAGWRSRLLKSGTLLAEKAGRRALLMTRRNPSGRAILTISDLGG